MPATRKKEKMLRLLRLLMLYTAHAADAIDRYSLISSKSVLAEEVFEAYFWTLSEKTQIDYPAFWATMLGK